MTSHPGTIDPLDLLGHANPVPRAPARPGLDQALDEVASAIARQPYNTRGLARPWRRSISTRPRLRIALVVGVVALVAAGVSTAAIALHAHTGIFASGADVQPGGPGENLNLAAPDFPSVALKLSADIPYPAGYASWRSFVLTEQELGPGGAAAGGQVTSGALRGSFAASAFCAWVQDWRQAVVQGDTAAVKQAAATIVAAPSWSAVTAEDPHPSASAPNDPNAEPGTLFGWMLPYRSAVLAGDQGAVEQMLASGWGDGKCWLADPQWMSQFSSWSQLSPRGIASRYEQFLAKERS